MHTFELQQNISQFFDGLESWQPFISVLSSLAESAATMERSLIGIARGGDQLHSHANQVHNYLAQTQRTTSAINNRNFFKALEHFQRSITQLHSIGAPSAKLITGLSDEVEEFADIYDGFISSPSADKALPLLLSAKVLYVKFGAIIELLQFIQESVGEYDVPSSSEASLSLLLPAHLDVTEFARKLVAIQSLYTELCMLLSVSESTHPLRISKIESGSLWVKVFGESKVIYLVVSFVENAASWLYRNYTVEGKIASIPRRVEAVDSLLRLREQLKESGLDTVGMEEHIEKSAVVISKSLSDLLDGQPSVTLNKQTISIVSEQQKLFLERTVPRQLENSEKTTDDQPQAPPASE